MGVALKKTKRLKRKKKVFMEHPGGTAGKGPRGVAAVVWVQSLAWELPYAVCVVLKKKKKNFLFTNICRRQSLKLTYVLIVNKMCDNISYDYSFI